MPFPIGKIRAGYLTRQAPGSTRQTLPPKRGLHPFPSAKSVPGTSPGRHPARGGGNTPPENPPDKPDRPPSRWGLRPSLSQKPLSGKPPDTHPTPPDKRGRARYPTRQRFSPSGRGFSPPSTPVAGVCRVGAGYPTRQGFSPSGRGFSPPSTPVAGFAGWVFGQVCLPTPPLPNAGVDPVGLGGGVIENPPRLLQEPDGLAGLL